jgi:hypothetical protein
MAIKNVKTVKLIVMSFMICNIVFFIIYLIEKNTGDMLINMGSLLFFVLGYYHPEMLLITKFSETHEHTRNFKNVEHMMLWSSISLLLLGLFINIAYE